MLELRDKTILIVSPQKWTNMFISKNHYAAELAKRGNRVFFLNPPAQGRSRVGDRICMNPSPIPGLTLIDHHLFFPYRLKFHALPLFHRLMQRQVKDLLRKIGTPVDIIWSFDIGNLYPFRLFGKDPAKIFHPVDEPLNRAAIESAKDADIIFSVTREILQKYTQFPAPGHLINHGVSEEFLLPVDVHKHRAEPIRIGFSGNLLRPDIDRPILLQIIRENPAIVFECWGTFTPAKSVLEGGDQQEAMAFIEQLKTLQNVTLHGAIPSSQLAASIHRMDGFLICYDIQKDQSKGTNYHKIMEFLSTGKVIVSNNVTAYSDRPDLVTMVTDREHNRGLPGLFRKVMVSLDSYNSPDLQTARITTAGENSYKKQIDRIEAIL